MRPIAHTIVSAEDSEPKQFMVFAHGILGTKANWRTVARRFVQARPDWGAVLVDLREHGDSRSYSPPHTVRACADDLVELQKHLDLPIKAMLGHSFGGKVALQWAALNREASQIWVVDASPGQRNVLRETSGVLEVLHTLQGMPTDFDGTNAFIEAVVAASHPERTARWLAMNLNKTAPGKRSMDLDLYAIESLLNDYATVELWNVFAEVSDATRIDLVVGGKSNVVSTKDKLRLSELEQMHPGLTVHTIAKAGHWVHADAPAELLALLIEKSPVFQ